LRLENTQSQHKHFRRQHRQKSIQNRKNRQKKDGFGLRAMAQKRGFYQLKQTLKE
jgi:hypothetical protein